MKKLSIIIPVYNERNTLEEMLQKVEEIKLDYPLVKEIIIIDDASNDGTEKIIENKFKTKHKIIRHEKNLGKGAAIRSDFKIATGDYLIVQDADLEYDPEDYNDLLRPIIEDKADVVVGSRFVGNKPHRTLFFSHYLGNRFLTFLSNLFTGLNLTDMETCYKAFNRKAIDILKGNLISNRFGIEPEIIAKVAKANLRIYEIGIAYYGRNYSEGKKINWLDGVAAVWHIIRFNIFK